MQTIENTRDWGDDTPVAASASAQEPDEFTEHFDRLRPPKVLVTTCYKPSAIMYKFLAELLQVPCACLQ